MVFSRQIRTQELSRLCRRLATALEAGVDVRKVWQREADGRVSGGLAARMRTVRDAVDRGDSLHEALETTGRYFPTMFRQLVGVGEQTGQLPEVLKRLADHYEHQLRLKREFLGRIAWPLIQLAIAVFVVGFLIWILGIIADFGGGKPLDVLALGLVGSRGATIYFASVAAFVGVLVTAVWLTRRLLVDSAPWHHFLLKLPWVGSAVRTLALSRMAWTLHLTDETGMDLREAIPLVLGSTGNAYYAGQRKKILDEINEGATLCMALEAAGGYPRDFLDTLEVGEESGQISESMGRLSRQYEDQAQKAMTVLTTVAGFLVWALVAAILVVVIFRLFFVGYLGPINEQLKLMR